jgi:pimeloyl-ACP methyl ester carboxylesterase
MPEAPRTRYALSGDAHIAYQVFGQGDLDLVFVPGFVSNIEHYWEVPGIPTVLDRLGSFARVVIFDKRGTGLSDPVAEPPPLDQRMDDMQAVMGAVGLERAALYGISEGGPTSLLFAATHPDRVSALVLYGSTPRFREAPGYPGWPEVAEREALEAVERDWGQGAMLELFAPSAANDPAVREVWGRFQRASASPAMARAVIEAWFRIDVRDILPSIRVPTLILHRTGDRIAPVQGARFMAERIPGARYVEFDETDHLPFRGDVDSLAREELLDLVHVPASASSPPTMFAGWR